MNSSVTGTVPSALPSSSFYRDIDHWYRAGIGHAAGGLSPMHLAGAWFDWIGHLATAPGRQLELAVTATRDTVDLSAKFIAGMGDTVLTDVRVTEAPATGPGTALLPRHDPDPTMDDRRFQGPDWKRFPYNLIVSTFLAQERLIARALHDVPGVDPRSESTLAFFSRQLVDVFAPSNLPWLNPEVMAVSLQEGGKNWLRGATYWVDDTQRAARNQPFAGAEVYLPGSNVALTTGKVVFRNDLIELIQYSPATETVLAEPVLIVPAWIMKYYILDLSQRNSLVRHLVEAGHTVFMISWRNPGSAQRELGMEDYRTDGVMAAIDTVTAIVPDRKVHGVGYCLGGTMLMIAAAAMGRDGDSRLASLTLLAAQADFSEAGELMLFISQSQVDIIESLMWEQGTLEGRQMAAAFQLLHANDLVWSRVLKEYMLGRRSTPTDLMAWNADTTRMPYRMHSEYLRKLFLRNELSSGHFRVGGRPVWLTDIHVPCFAVATTADHVAPWRSVYKVHLLPLDVTFVLTKGGHNAGILSEPGHPHRDYRIHHRPQGTPAVSTGEWLAQAERREGSWWSAWQDWLAAHSGEPMAPPRMGLPGAGTLTDAPGAYVFDR